MPWITTSKLHYVVTDVNTKYTDLNILKCKWRRSTIISSSQVASFVIRARYSFRYLKLKLECTIKSPQQNGTMNLKAVGSLSRLHLEKNEQKKGYVSRLNRNCFFGQFAHISLDPSFIKLNNLLPRVSGYPAGEGGGRERGALWIASSKIWTVLIYTAGSGGVLRAPWANESC